MMGLPQVTRIVVTGVLMGAAEVVPGVSGGTIAFISGFYERLILALRQFRPALVLTLVRQGWLQTWMKVDGAFLLLLFGGMFVSIATFARGVSWLLANEPIAIWSFFFGLVVASITLVGRQIRHLSMSVVFAGVAGVLVGVSLTMAVPVELSPTPMVLFAGGAVAVCAWILPGMSGSFILLVLGLYGPVIDAVKAVDISSLAALALGCACGLMAFAQVLGGLLARYHSATITLLTGFMIGSLVKLWPWQQTLAYQLKPDGSSYPLEQDPVFPAAYLALTGQDPQVILALVMGVFGAILVVSVDYGGRQLARAERQ